MNVYYQKYSRPNCENLAGLFFLIPASIIDNMYAFNAKISASGNLGLPPPLTSQPSTLTNWKEGRIWQLRVNSEIYSLMDDSLCALRACKYYVWICVFGR